MYHFLPWVVCRASRLEMTTDRDWRLFRSQRERSRRTFDKWPWLNCETRAICLHNITRTKSFNITLYQLKSQCELWPADKTWIWWWIGFLVGANVHVPCYWSILLFSAKTDVCIICQPDGGHYENQFLYLPSLFAPNELDIRFQELNYLPRKIELKQNFSGAQKYLRPFS